MMSVCVSGPVCLCTSLKLTHRPPSFVPTSLLLLRRRGRAVSDAAQDDPVVHLPRSSPLGRVRFRLSPHPHGRCDACRNLLLTPSPPAHTKKHIPRTHRKGGCASLISGCCRLALVRYYHGVWYARAVWYWRIQVLRHVPMRLLGAARY